MQLRLLNSVRAGTVTAPVTVDGALSPGPAARWRVQVHLTARRPGCPIAPWQRTCPLPTSHRGADFGVAASVWADASLSAPAHRQPGLGLGARAGIEGLDTGALGGQRGQAAIPLRPRPAQKGRGGEGVRCELPRMQGGTSQTPNRRRSRCRQVVGRHMLLVCRAIEAVSHRCAWLSRLRAVLQVLGCRAGDWIAGGRHRHPHGGSGHGVIRLCEPGPDRIPGCLIFALPCAAWRPSYTNIVACKARGCLGASRLGPDQAACCGIRCSEPAGACCSAPAWPSDRRSTTPSARRSSRGSMRLRSPARLPPPPGLERPGTFAFPPAHSGGVGTGAPAAWCMACWAPTPPGSPSGTRTPSS